MLAMTHPDLPGVTAACVDIDQYEQVYRARGWQLADGTVEVGGGPEVHSAAPAVRGSDHQGVNAAPAGDPAGDGVDLAVLAALTGDLDNSADDDDLDDSSDDLDDDPDPAGDGHDQETTP